MYAERHRLSKVKSILNFVLPPTREVSVLEAGVTANPVGQTKTILLETHEKSSGESAQRTKKVLYLCVE